MSPQLMHNSNLVRTYLNFSVISMSMKTCFCNFYGWWLRMCFVVLYINLANFLCAYVILAEWFDSKTITVSLAVFWKQKVCVLGSKMLSFLIYKFIPNILHLFSKKLKNCCITSTSQETASINSTSLQQSGEYPYWYILWNIQ